MAGKTSGASRGRPAGASIVEADETRPLSQTPGPAAILRRLGLRAHKGLSQAFLTDSGVCRKMADDADLGPDDEVLEIGPGLGILTRVLLTRAKRVLAVELDRQLAEHLPSLVDGHRLEVVRGDALQFEPAQHLAGSYKLIANLPYQITSPVLRRFLVEVRRPSVLVLMVQREVAERIVAPVGDSSYLSIMARAIADVEIRRNVPPGAFYPRPRVTSSVLLLRPRAGPAVPDASLPAFLALVRAGFAQPRKMLANSLAQGLQVSRQEAEATLVAAGVAPTRRPQSLAVEEWVSIFRSSAENTAQ